MRRALFAQKNFQKIDLDELEQLLRKNSESKFEEAIKPRSIFSFLKSAWRIQVLISAS
jgi:hypothetical protein